jgi:hypothetical protein
LPFHYFDIYHREPIVVAGYFFIYSFDVGMGYGDLTIGNLNSRFGN